MLKNNLPNSKPINRLGSGLRFLVGMIILLVVGRGCWSIYHSPITASELIYPGREKDVIMHDNMYGHTSIFFVAERVATIEAYYQAYLTTHQVPFDILRGSDGIDIRVHMSRYPAGIVNNWLYIDDEITISIPKLHEPPVPVSVSWRKSPMKPMQEIHDVFPPLPPP